MNIKVNIWRQEYIYDKNWKFTKRIKYEKYSDLTNIYFEISYIEMESSDSIWWFIGWLLTFGFLYPPIIETTITKWIHEKSLLIHEIPEETIVSCSVRGGGRPHTKKG